MPSNLKNVNKTLLVNFLVYLLKKKNISQLQIIEISAYWDKGSL